MALMAERKEGCAVGWVKYGGRRLDESWVLRKGDREAGLRCLVFDSFAELL